MQEDLTGATTTEPRLATYAVSWRMMTDLCESTRERCRRSGEGWVIDPRRPPTLISIAYLCEEHARGLHREPATARREGPVCPRPDQ